MSRRSPAISSAPTRAAAAGSRCRRSGCWRPKGSDTFSPIGPFIATNLGPANIGLRTRVNGVEAQAGNTRDLIHPLASMISFASRVMTLEPGDILFTGTPGEPPKLADGDA